MTLSELRRKPHLSVSSVGAYLDCGLNFWFSRVFKAERDHLSATLMFGITIHEVLNDYNQGRLTDPAATADPNQMANNFIERWEKFANRKDLLYPKDSSHESMREMGIGMIRLFAEEFRPEHEVIATELPFSFMIPGVDVPIIGGIDLVEQDQDGAIWVTDYKTLAKSLGKKGGDGYSFQLAVYQMALNALGMIDGNPMRYKLDCLIKTKIPKYEQVPVEPVSINRVMRKIQAAYRGIKAELWLPNDGGWRCGVCEFKSHCDRWFEGEDFQAPNLVAATAPAEPAPAPNALTPN